MGFQGQVFTFLISAAQCEEASLLQAAGGPLLGNPFPVCPGPEASGAQDLGGHLEKSAGGLDAVVGQAEGMEDQAALLSVAGPAG